MRSSALQLSSSLASHPSSSRSLLGILIISLCLSTNLNAQIDSSKNHSSEFNTSGETSLKVVLENAMSNKNIIRNYAPNKKRIWFVAGANVVGYSATMIALSYAWYSQYDRTKFHTFNDFPEWKQVDKVGHLYSAYIESRGSMEMWRWTGIDRKKRIWIGGMSGAVYQTVIEVLDGYSAGWGWSWGDFGANILGSGAMIAQELAWDDQRIKLKFSFHKKSYADPTLNQRSDVLFGKTVPERLLKDYNSQTYWASANLKPFFKNSNIPEWLSVAVGYGAEGLFGGTENIGKNDNGNIIFNRTDIKRYRQWYIAPDIDLTKIKTNKKGLKFLFTVLSAFKFPGPSLELSNGKFKVHALHF
ncbi:MAG: DUF2279 domain-containing protein [Chitinophagaceae bacterium]